MQKFELIDKLEVLLEVLDGDNKKIVFFTPFGVVVGIPVLPKLRTELDGIKGDQCWAEVLYAQENEKDLQDSLNLLFNHSISDSKKQIVLTDVTCYTSATPNGARMKNFILCLDAIKGITIGNFEQ